MNTTRGDELASLLSRPDRAGVRHLIPGDGAALERAARALGFAVFRVDLADCADKADLLARIGTGLRFPDWFGHNLDALADCLGDMSWCPARGYVTRLAHADRPQRAAASDFAAVLEVFESAARDWAGEDVAMWTFVESEAAQEP